MVERRDVVMGSGLLAGMSALLTPASAAAAAQDGSPQVAQAINGLRETIATELEAQRTGPWRGIALIREQQRSWLRSTQKYPDFLEVGLEVWDSLHEWHVRYQQPINMARMTDGRYGMVFMFTTVILRPEQAPLYIGPPYDAQPPRR
jgi:hypothetical protein